MDPEIIGLVVTMTVLGSAMGTFTGMVPGIHVNTLSAVMASMLPVLSELLSPFVNEGYTAICVSSCIFSASIVHSFVDYVPSLFIGAPDPDDVVSMLPGHRLLAEGLGMSAVRSAAIGSCVGACSSILLSIPMQYLLLSGLGDYLDGLTWIVLIAAVLMMILHEKSVRGMFWATICLTVSGLLGIVCMDLPIPSTGITGEGTLLFPLLTGLFGIPGLLQSMGKTELKEQKDDIPLPVGPVPGIKGLLTGTLTGWFPGITATTGAVIASKVSPENTREGFIALTASIGTASSIMMLTTLSVTGKGRSGCLINISEILGDTVIGWLKENYLLLLLTASVAAFIGYGVTISCGKLMCSFSSEISPKILNGSCLVLVVILVILMTGPYGLMILIISSFCGFLPIAAGVSRIQMTGCLIVPTLLTYLNVRDFLISMLINP